jgi:hypothetical protein
MIASSDNGFFTFFIRPSSTPDNINNYTVGQASQEFQVLIIIVSGHKTKTK